MRARSFFAIGLAALAFALSSVVPATALANGRFPFANQLVVDPGDDTHLVLRTTYGILQSDDAGQHWTWVCETSVGYTGVLDPAMGVTQDGTVLAGVFDGLSVSHDRGCGWDYALGDLEKQYVIDVAVEAKSPSNAVAVTATGFAASTHVVVNDTTDNGKTWERTGVPIPDDFTAETIETAPSDPKRLYVSGFVTVRAGDAGSDATPRQVAVIERSDDHGATWTRLPVTLADGLEIDDTPYIGAVDPGDPDRVYLRLDGDGPDSLLVSSDGGKSWVKAITFVSDMLGFAISPDGSRIAAGGTKDGLQIASKSDLIFKRAATIQVRCLTWSTRGLYACAAEFPDLYTVGITTDEGATFSPLYRLAELAERACADTTKTGKVCPAEWQAVVDLLGIGAEPDDASPDVDSASSDGGVAPADHGSAGCGCGVPGNVSGPLALFAAASTLGLLAMRRRRR